MKKQQIPRPGQGSDDLLDGVVVALDRLTKSVVGLAGGLVVLIVIVAVCLFWLYQKRHEVVALDAAGRAIPLKPIDPSSFSDMRVSAFSEEGLRRCFAHDFENVGFTMNECYAFMNPDGIESFRAQIEPYIAVLKARRYVMNVSIDKPPMVVKKDFAGGPAHWYLQAIVYMNLFGQSDRKPPQRLAVTMTVVAVPQDVNPRGLTIGQFNMSPAQ